jgi:hypothetical protein
MYYLSPLCRLEGAIGPRRRVAAFDISAGRLAKAETDLARLLAIRVSA